MAKRLKVLVASWFRWPSPARLAAAMADAGAQVEAACPPGHPLLALKGLGARHAYDVWDPVGSLQKAIERAQPDLIVPCDDVVLTHLLAARQNHARADSEVARCIERSIAPSRAYPILLSRSALMTVAREEQILAPETAAVSSADELAAWISRRQAPAFLKSDGSYGGAGVIEIANAGAARRAFHKLTRRPSLISIAKEIARHQTFFAAKRGLGIDRAAVSVQLAVPGRPANCSFAASKGQVLAMVAAEALETVHPFGVATKLRLIESPAMRRAAERLAARLALTGLFGLDFIMAAGDGRPWLIELNARPTPISHLCMGPESDVVGAFLSQAAGSPAAARPCLAEGASVALFPHALEADVADLEPQGLVVDLPLDQPDLMKLYQKRRRARPRLDQEGSPEPAADRSVVPSASANRILADPRRKGFG